MKAQKEKAEEGKTNVTEGHTHAEDEHQAESSNMAFTGPFRADAFNSTFELGDPAVSPVSNQATANSTPRLSPMSPQLAAHSPSSPQMSIDSVLLALDAERVEHGRERSGSRAALRSSSI